jgi:hypothetical protein
MNNSAAAAAATATTTHHHPLPTSNLLGYGKGCQNGQRVGLDPIDSDIAYLVRGAKRQARQYAAHCLVPELFLGGTVPEVFLELSVSTRTKAHFLSSAAHDSRLRQQVLNTAVSTTHTDASCSKYRCADTRPHGITSQKTAAICLFLLLPKPIVSYPNVH